MARGTDFGGVHSFNDLHLLQASVEVAPAEPKLNFIDIPGADGAKDFTESPAGRVVYNTREITWVFRLYPGDHWAAKYTQVSNALNGRACHITLDDDPDYYYVGRVAVDKHDVDGILHRITVVATCQPYKLAKTQTQTTRSLNRTSFTSIVLSNDRMPVIPKITLTMPTTLEWQGDQFTLSAGTHELLDIMLAEGSNTLKAKVAASSSSSTGSITIVYRKGAL